MQLLPSPLYVILPLVDQFDIPDIDTLGPEHHHLFKIYPVHAVLSPTCILIQNQLHLGPKFFEFWGPLTPDPASCPPIMLFQSLVDAEDALNILLDITPPEPMLDNTDIAPPIP